MNELASPSLARMGLLGSGVLSFLAPPPNQPKPQPFLVALASASRFAVGCVSADKREKNKQQKEKWRRNHIPSSSAMRRTISAFSRSFSSLVFSRGFGAKSASSSSSWPYMMPFFLGFT